MSNPNSTSGATVASLPPEAIAFASKMYDAARNGDIEVFEQALPAGLPANMTNEKGDSLVCSIFSKIAASRLLDEMKSWVPRQGSPGVVHPIMLAAYHGHAPLVRLLLQHGANPNSLNDRGQSPLAGAVFKGETEVVEALLEGNADPEHGSPSALRAVELFRQEEKWLKKFEEAPGRGKAV